MVHVAEDFVDALLVVPPTVVGENGMKSAPRHLYSKTNSWPASG